MSWMDSWSRPSKSQATPAPYYLLLGGEGTPYCYSCGRVVGTRKQHAAANAHTAAKYCSSKCRAHKPGKLDRKIERAIAKFLLGNESGDGNEGIGKHDVGGHASKGKKKNAKKHAKVKGDPRILVACSTIEEFVFGPDLGEENVSVGSRRSVEDKEQDEHAVHATISSAGLIHPSIIEGESARDEILDGDVLARMSIRSGTRIRPPQSVSQVNGSVGGEKGRAERIEETEEMLEKRRLGQKMVREKEMAKCAARRGIVFGFEVEVDEHVGGSGSTRRRLCEAVMAGKMVEPSFAKRDWGISWRE